MKYMLDTNACIHIMKNKPLSVMKRFRQHESSDVCISSITYAELCHGIDKSRNREQNRLALSVFLAGIQIIPFDARAAIQFGSLCTRLELAGTPIGVMDTLIASHALSLGLTVVTNNTREFSRVPGLPVEDWVS